MSYWSRTPRPPDVAGTATWRDIDDLVAGSDVLIDVVTLGPATRGLLGAERIAALPPGAIVIDAARGGIVDQAAVLEGVEAGRLAGAAFDVFATEPLPLDSPLRRSGRIRLTSHLAGVTQESFQRNLGMIRANLQGATTGEPLVNVVNGADPVARRRS